MVRTVGAYSLLKPMSTHQSCVNISRYGELLGCGLHINFYNKHKLIIAVKIRG